MTLTQGGIDHSTRSASYKGLLNGTGSSCLAPLSCFACPGNRPWTHRDRHLFLLTEVLRDASASRPAPHGAPGAVILAFPESAHPLSYLHSTSEKVILLQHFRSFRAGRSFRVWDFPGYKSLILNHFRFQILGFEMLSLELFILWKILGTRFQMRLN